MVDEELLWVLWQHLLFDARGLCTVTGESVSIRHTGTINSHSGPDFNLSKLKIGEIEWRGDVEIHVRSSDWYKHNHQEDPAYESVILHVVYEFDEDIFREDGTVLPVLELRNRIAEKHLQTYRYLKQNKSDIPCSAFLSKVNSIVAEQMKQRVLIERLKRKTENLYLQLLDQPDWKTIAGRLIFKSFGTGLNDFLFERMASHIDFTRIARLSYSKISIEALFFGMAGMLELPFRDDYPKELIKEYEYLKRMYDIKPVVMYSEWKFLRTRPINFPTIRIAQLASLFSNPDWYSMFISLQNPDDAKSLFEKEVSPYWHTHYRFDVPSVHSFKNVGKSFILLFLINGLVPYYVLEARYHNDPDKWDNVFSLLETMDAEDNTIIRNLTNSGMVIKNAFDSQSGIELYKMYCTHKKCLSCTIGHAILRNEYIPDYCS